MNEYQLAVFENTDITAWDFDTIRASLRRGLDTYAGMVYTDDSIKDAKNDRAALNKVKKAIEEARKAYKARCLAPYEALEPRIKELVDMVEQQRLLIDDTVKNYENRQKEEKEREIRSYYDRKAVILGNMADVLYPKLFDKKWVSASASRAKYEESILDAINRAQVDLDAIRAMKSPFADTLFKVYAETQSMEKVREKNAEYAAAASGAGLKTKEEAAGASASLAAGAERNGAPAQPLPEEAGDGVTVKIYADPGRVKQITDFMEAIGVRYEFL